MNDFLRPRTQKPLWKKPIVWLPVAALLLGLMIGSAGSNKAEAEPQAVPTVTATATVTSPPKIETKTVTVEKTPAECLTALDLAGEGFSYSSESMGYMRDGVNAASQYDVAGIKQATANIASVNPKMDALAPKLKVAVAACRAKG